VALVVLMGAPACTTPPAPEVAAPDPAIAALTAVGERLLARARAGDTAGVAAVLAEHAPTASELATLFGPDAGPRLAADYEKRILPALRAESGPVLVAAVAAGRDQIQVEAVGPAFPARTTPGDTRRLEAARQPLRMYTLRLHRPGEKLGLRLDGFVQLGGRWCMLATLDPGATPG
jgi:hypothetical protein